MYCPMHQCNHKLKCHLNRHLNHQPNRYLIYQPRCCLMYRFHHIRKCHSNHQLNHQPNRYLICQPCRCLIYCLMYQFNHKLKTCSETTNCPQDQKTSPTKSTAQPAADQSPTSSTASPPVPNYGRSAHKNSVLCNYRLPRPDPQ